MYYSHLSAAKIWDVPCIETVVGNRDAKSDSTEITVSKNNARFYVNGKKVRSCKLDLPIDAIVERNGMMVASPELLFLEFASELSIQRLILLGLQLCSHDHGKPHEAITTREKLESFIANAAGHRGYRNAVRALRYVQNGSASIMESLAYMILTLPYVLGGYGLHGAAFNYEIEIKNEIRNHLKKNHCYADLYYKNAKLAVEYDSFAFHNSPAVQGQDALRSSALERQGIKVMRMNTIQLYDREACRLFAHNLAFRLKKRIYIRTKSFDKMHMALRELLPTEIPKPLVASYKT